MRNSPRPVSINLEPVRTFSRLKLYLAVLAASQCMLGGQALAAPDGGEIVGGEGIIQQTGVETIITQATERMAIDWRSFDVAANERVEFIQPNASSIALNRVLSNRGSEILGRIDANGQVMLVNANGVVFGKDSIVNVGGMIASGLNIDPTSFINGDFTLSSIEGAEGKVINYGIINAATGGSVTLVGEQVQNDGLISAKLGAVNLVAGNAAVLTFDPSGMVGIRVTEAVVQDELGVDAAVINNGSINAQGGRVLLSASVSEDVFSNAVNNAGMNKASSVVVHEDGSFTLGAGGDVVNTGDISVSTIEGNAGQVVALGENITHSGSISANTLIGVGGSVELHSTDTTLLTENSIISAQASAQGEGGDVKVLGNKVGLFDHAEVNASGANGGGQVLIGGDKTGQNQQVRNADFIYLSEDSSVKTDALINGDGGKLITFASDTARIYGNLYSRGGSESGNGGFIETSGLKGFEILNTPDITAAAGTGGTWLIDPYNIQISSDTNNLNPVTNETTYTFTSNNGVAVLNTNTLRNALTNGSKVIVQTGNGGTGETNAGDITISNRVTFNIDNGSGGDGTATLRLLAHRDININATIERDNDINANNNGNNNQNNTGKGILNLELIANKDNSSGADGGSIFVADGVTIATNGGYFYAGKSAEENSNGLLSNGNHTNKLYNFNSTNATISTYGALGGGDIVINATNNVDLGIVNFGYLYSNAQGSNANLIRVGSVDINSGGNVTLHSEINFNDTGKRQGDTGNKGYSGNLLDNEDTFLKVTAFGDININAVIRDKDYGDYRDALNIDLTAGKDNSNGGTIHVNADIYTAGGNFTASAKNFDSIGYKINTDRANERTNDSASGTMNGNARWSNGGNITINASENVNLGALITDALAERGNREGNLIIQGINLVSDISLDNLIINQNDVLNVAGNSIFNVGVDGNITLQDANNSFTGNISFLSGKDVKLSNSTSLILNDTRVSGALELMGDGITQVAGKVLQVADTTELDAKEKAVTLNNENNDFIGLVTVTNASDLSLRDINSLSVGALSTSGNISLTSGSHANDVIVLNGDINTTAGSTDDKDITVNGNTVLANTVTLTTDDGDITFKGTTNSIDTTPRNLALVANTISFEGAVGASNSVGAFEITASGAVEFKNLANVAQNIFANSLLVNGASRFLSNNIVTLGGSVDITAADLINVNLIDTSAETAGLIALTVNGIGETKSININGDLNARNTVTGQATINLTLDNSVAAGSINFNSNAFLTSNVSAKGLGLSDTIKLTDTSNTWTLTGANTGEVTNTGNFVTPIISFEGFETLSGGAAADSFTLSHNVTGAVNGGGGADIFTITTSSLDASVNGDDGNDTFNINVATARLILNGNAGADIFNVNSTGNITATLTGGGGTDTINSANRVNNWILGTTESLNGTLGFSGIENITGSAQKDSFSFVGTRAVNGIINADAAGIGVINSLEDEVTVSGDGNIDFAAGNFSFFGVLNAEVLHSTGGGKLTVLSNTADTINWKFSDEQLVTKGTSEVKISGFTSYEGGAGSDIFTIEDNTKFSGLIDGKGGQNIFDFHAATDGYSIVLGNEYQTGSSATLFNISEIIANSHADTSLKALAGTNVWNITAKNAGRVGTTTFNGISTVIGASSSDSISTSINGDATWSIIGANTGTLSSTPSSTAPEDLISFIGIGNLVGSNYNDTFAFIPGSSIVSAEGNGGTDTADLSAIAPRTITIGTALEFAFSGVEILKADISKDFTLAASSSASWLIDNSDGIIDGTVAGIKFVGFKNLQGSSQADTFDIHTDFTGTIKSMGGDDTFNIRTAFTGSLESGDGADSFVFFDGGSIDVVNGGSADAGNDPSRDVVDLRNLTTGVPIIITGTSIHNVSGIERVIADSSKEFTLAANAGTNTWRIENNGVIDGTVAGIEFAGFRNLRGGTGADIFDLFTNFTGTINGMGGNDVFNIRTTITGSLLGGNGADSFVFFDGGSIDVGNGGSADAGSDLSKDLVDLRNLTTGVPITITGTSVRNVTNIERVIADSSKEFTLTTSADTNTWRIENNGVIDGTVAGIEFAGFRNLRGGAGVDIFDLFTNFTGTINGMGGDDVFNIRTNFTGRLLGGNGADSFIFFDGGNINVASGGSADAGNDSSIDVVDLRNLTTGITVTIAGTSIHNIANIERVIADSAKESTLAISAGTNTWRIENNGVIDGTVAGIEFAGFRNLHGGTGADTFELYSNFTGLIDGRGGDDIFRIRTNFTGHLLGGEGADRFVFFDGGIIDSVNGGSADAGNGKDIIDFGNLPDGMTVYVDGTLIHNIANVEQLIGSATKNFTLAATSGTNNWLVTGSYNGDNFSNGENDGVVNGIQFIKFKRLVGGSGSDIFTIASGASIEAIDGGAGDNTLVGRDSLNTWRVTSANSGSLAVTNGNTYVPLFERIQNLTGGSLADEFIVNAAIGSLIGNNGNDRFVFNSGGNIGSARLIDGGGGDDEIIGRNTNNTWSITDDNAGSVFVTGGTAYINSFLGVDKLIGGAGADVFNINFSIRNGIEAGDGDNVFNVNTAVGDLIGGAGDDQFTFLAQGSARSIVGGGGTNSIYGRNAENTWTITAPNSGSIRTGSNDYVESFSNIQVLNGGNLADIFNINAAVTSIFGHGGDDVFSFAGNNNGIVDLIDGGDGNNILRGRNQNSIWTMTAANSGSVSTTSSNSYVSTFHKIKTLIGNADADTLVALNQENSWTINGNNRGFLHAASTPDVTVAFEGIENLLGNQGVDLFTFTANGYITGLIDGGSTDSKNIIKDTLDLSEITGNVRVELGNQQTDALNVVNVEEIKASASVNNDRILLGASDTAYRWRITGINQGIVETAENPLVETSVSFVNFNDIRGGANSDRFDVAQGEITKRIDGGSGIDFIDYSQRKENFEIELGGSGGFGTTGVHGIEGVVGNSGSGSGFTSTIKVSSGDNNWEIGTASSSLGDGINDGSITINGNKVTFENFTNIIGGSGRDTFKYLENGQWIGTISGGGGHNIIDASLSIRDQQFVLDGAASDVGTKFRSIAQLIGNASTNSKLTSTLQANTWEITTQGNGRLNNLAFSNIANLQGGAFVDVFNISNLSWLTGVIDGGGGEGIDTVNLQGINRAVVVAVDSQTPADINIVNVESINSNTSFSNTLKGDWNGNEWNINARNAGILNKTINFTGFENLTGSAMADLVVFENTAANLTGHIDLGAGQDVLDLRASGRNVAVQLSSSQSTVINGVISVKDIEEIKGAANSSNHLIADNYNNNWVIDEVDGGRVSSVETGTTTFTNFKNLTGGNKDDLFIFEALGNATGLIDGGAHSTRDTVDLSKSNNANVVVASSGDLSGFSNIEKYIGNNVSSKFTAANVDNTWSLSGTNRGTLNGTIEFENFGILVGGNRRDEFAINNANISGSIDSGDGDDTFNIQGSTIGGSIDSGDGNDTFNIQASAIAGKIKAGNGNDRFTFTIVPGAEGTATIEGGEGDNRLTVEGGDASYRVTHQIGRQEYADANNNTYSILHSQMNNVFDNVIANSLSIFGTTSADTFRLQNARYSTNNINTVNYTNKSNLVINGSADDQAIVDGTVGIESTITFNNVRIFAENEGRIQARLLELENTGDVGSASNRLNTAVNELSLNATNGAVFLEEQDGLVLKNFNVSTTNMVDLKVGGNLSTLNPLAYTGSLNLESLRGNIELGSNNLLSGLLNLKASGNIFLGNSQSLLIGDLTAQNANLGSGASIRGSGVFSVSGMTTLHATNDITLLNVSNDLNQIAITQADTAEIFDRNGFSSVGITVANTLGLRSIGNISVGTSCTTDCTNSYGISAKNLKIQSDAAVTVAKNIAATDTIEVNAQGITVNDSITSKQFILNAGNGKLLLNEGGSLLGQSGNNIDLFANNIEQYSTIVSNGNIKAQAAGDIVMAERAVMESLGGNVELNSRNLQLGQIKAIAGSAVTNAQGAITDGNGGAMNIIASQWHADALNGIGRGVGQVGDFDAIETDVGRLSVRNAGNIQSGIQGSTKPLSIHASGNMQNNGQPSTINISNANALVIEQLRNNGHITLFNVGDVTLDNTNNQPFDITIPDARIQGGVINTNTENAGQLVMNVTGGMVRAENKANKKNPDIIADVASFKLSGGYDFGERNRKIILHVPEYYAQESRYSFREWHISRPRVIVDLSRVPPDSFISGRDQLIQIEGLSEVDPAIFTSLRNYVHDEVAILLPLDQRFDDDDVEIY